MTHPFAWLSLTQQFILLMVLVAGTVFMQSWLGKLNHSLRTSDARWGILSLQFAWCKRRAELVLKSWDSRLNIARRQTKLDFGYILLYSPLLSLTCAVLAQEHSGMLSQVGQVLSWLALGAGALDGVENVALLRMLDRGPNHLAAGLASSCATGKFAIIFACLTYIVFAMIWRM